MRLIPVLAGLLLAATNPVQGAGEEPRAVVQKVSDQVLTVLSDRAQPAEQRRKRIEAIVLANTDFDTLTRLVLARNYARFSDAQRAAFTEEFRHHLSVTYGRNIDRYNNERVEVVGDREEARGDWTVQTRVVGGDHEPVVVDYRLRKVGGEWKVIDFVIEHVSLVANFRSQFQDIMGRGKGPDDLIAVLREKTQRGETFETDGKK